MSRTLVIIMFLATFAARAHLGDAITDCDQRYGGGKPGRQSAADQIKPLVTGPNTTNLTYLFQGFTIRIGFEKSVATRIDYTKMGSAKLTTAEIQGILDANSGDSEWRQLARYDYELSWPGMSDLVKSADSGRMWLRRDNTVAYLYSLGRSMRLIHAATHPPDGTGGIRTKPSSPGMTKPAPAQRF